MQVSIFNDTFATAYKKNGFVAQLNRASDYGSEGSGFESQRSHFLLKVSYDYGSVAQLNRASDYGSEGSGFESQRSHVRKGKANNTSFLFYCVVIEIMNKTGRRQISV